MVQETAILGAALRTATILKISTGLSTGFNMRDVAASRLGAAFVGICAVLCGCSDDAPTIRARVVSPDGKLEVVLAEWPTNATSGRSLGVGVVRRDVPAEQKDFYVYGDGLLPEGIKWIDGSQVQVTYKAGTLVNRFSNMYWRSSEEGQPPERIELILIRQD